MKIEIGNKGSSSIKLTVVDDVPTAVNDTEVSIVEGSSSSLSGNVVTNDSQGADGAVLHNFTYSKTDGSTDIKVFSNTTTTYTVITQTGSLTVNKNGAWSFSPVASFDQ